MRIVDKIANRIIEMLEEDFRFKISQEEYLTCECAIADLIIDYLNEESDIPT